MTPDAIHFAAKVPESVEVGVEMSLWPLSPICHWQYGKLEVSSPLPGWGYTYVFYGGLLVAGVVAIVSLKPEILHSRRERREAKP
jgi:hypothetical protein